MKEVIYSYRSEIIKYIIQLSKLKMSYEDRILFTKLKNLFAVTTTNSKNVYELLYNYELILMLLKDFYIKLLK